MTRARAMFAIFAGISACTVPDDRPTASIVMTPVMTLEGSGDSLDLLGHANVERSSSGWLLVSGIASSRGHLAIFDSTGALKKVFLGEGSGPGEISVFRGWPHVAGRGFGPGDSLFVGDGRDARNTRMLVFSPPPEVVFVRSFMVPRLGYFAATDFGFLSPAHLSSPRAYPEVPSAGRMWIGVPPRGFSWAGTEYARFGPIAPADDERDVFGVNAAADSTHIWFGSGRKYQIDLLGPEAQRVRSITRDVPWFPVDTAESGFPWIKRPPTRISALTLSDSVLWVLITRASRHWEQRRPKNPPVMKPGMPIQMMTPYARTDLFESVLEAFDARSGRFLGTRELDGDFRGFNRARQLLEPVEDSTGAVKLRLWKLSVERAR